MQGDEMARDGQAQPQSAVHAGGGRILLPERLENMRHELRRDALAGIGDRQLRLGIRCRQSNRHLAVGRRELDGVRQQVQDDPL